MLVFHISIPGCAAVVALAPRVADFIFALGITYRLNLRAVVDIFGEVPKHIDHGPFFAIVAPARTPLIEQVAPRSTPGIFKCEGKTTCSQMTACEEPLSICTTARVSKLKGTGMASRARSSGARGDDRLRLLAIRFRRTPFDGAFQPIYVWEPRQC